MKILWGDIEQDQQDLIRELVEIITKEPAARLVITTISGITGGELDDLQETMESVVIYEDERYD